MLPSLLIKWAIHPMNLSTELKAVCRSAPHIESESNEEKFHDYMKPSCPSYDKPNWSQQFNFPLLKQIVAASVISVLFMLRQRYLWFTVWISVVTPSIPDASTNRLKSVPRRTVYQTHIKAKVLCSQKSVRSSHLAECNND